MGEMKWLLLPALAVPMLFSSCMTTEVLAKAQGKPLPGECEHGVIRNPAPLYYAMLPVSVPVDIVFYPLFYFRDQEIARQYADADCAVCY